MGLSVRGRFSLRWLWNFSKVFAVALQVLLLLYLITSSMQRDSPLQMKSLVALADKQIWAARNRQNQTFVYYRESPMVWVGGVPRSGTTLMRVMLDAHSEIRCGAETRIVPRMLSMRQQIGGQPVEQERLKEAGITETILDEATRAFLMEILTRYEEPSRILCCKDPFSLRFSVYIQRLFPSSKFVLMLRDGRAVVHSIISRQVTISGYDMTDYGNCLVNWDNTIRDMLHDCMRLGPSVCMPVFYELIVLRPEKYLRKICEFIGVDYDPNMMKYYEMVGEEGGIHVSKLERSTDQVKKPIYTDALVAWLKDFPRDILSTSHQRAPMLNILGYDFDPTDKDAEDKYGSLEAKLEALLKTWNNESVLLQEHVQLYQFKRPGPGPGMPGVNPMLGNPGMPGRQGLPGFMPGRPQQQQQQLFGQPINLNRPMNVGLQLAEQLRRAEQAAAAG